MNYASDFPGDRPLEQDRDLELDREAAEIIRGWEMKHPQDRLKHINGGGPPPHQAYPESADCEPVIDPPTAVQSFRPITPAAWKGTEAPKARWLATARIPSADLTILAGNGGSGKTEIAVQLLIYVAAGLADWLGCTIENGLALFISCEEPEEDIRDRVERICKHRGLDPHTIDHLHLFFPDLDATWLGSADRAGRISKTPLLVAIEKWIEQHKPCLVVIDSIAAVFDGEAIARRQVRAFLAMLRKIARQHGVAILLLDHPSVRGMADGTGTANSVDWRNSVRSMLHLSDPERDDPDARDLEVKKNNRGRIGEKVKLRWTGLTFTTETTASASPYRVAAEREIDELFLRLLDIKTAQGFRVSPNKSNTYAPSIFEQMPEAGGIKSKAFAMAQERLLSAGKLRVDTTGSASKPRSALVRKEASHG